MKTSPLLIAIITTAIFWTAVAESVAVGANPFAGTYTNDELTVEFLASTGAYTGTIKLGNQTFPLSATEKSGALEGAFVGGDDKFAFEAVLEGDSLTLSTEGTTYKLARQSTSRNPLVNCLREL